MLVKDFQTCLLIGWQHSRQPIRSHVRKSLLPNMELDMDFTWSPPALVSYWEWPWDTLTAMAGLRKSHKRNVVSLDDVNTIFWLLWAQTLVNSWSWPETEGEKMYCQTSNISHTSVANNIADHSDVCSCSIACRHCSNYILILDLTLDLMVGAKTSTRQDEKHLSLGIWYSPSLFRSFWILQTLKQSCIK